MQTHHSIRCWHKRCTNRHLSQHMIFWYCYEGSGEPVQRCRLPRAYAASTKDLNTNRIVQWLCLRKCTDSPEFSLLAWIAHESPFKAAQEILYSDEGKGKPVQMCRLARSFDTRTKWHSIAIWVTTWEFWTVTKAQTRPSKWADSPKPSLFAWMTPKNSKWVSQSQTADKPIALRGIATQQSRDTRKTN